MDILTNDIAIQKDCVRKEVCEFFMDVFKENKDLCQFYGKSSGHYFSGTQYSALSLSKLHNPRLYSLLKSLFQRSVNAYFEKLSLRYGDDFVFEQFELMVMKKNADGFTRHVDSSGASHNRILACILYLNTVESGGELVVHTSNKQVEVQPVQGNMLIMPTDWTYCHEVRTPLSSNRMSIITFVYVK